MDGFSDRGSTPLISTYGRGKGILPRPSLKTSESGFGYKKILLAKAGFPCGRRDLNPYPLPDTPLKRARMPIPPRPQTNVMIIRRSIYFVKTDVHKRKEEGKTAMRKGIRIAAASAFMLLALLFLSAAAYSEGVFSAQRAGQIVSHGENAFTVNAPESGDLTVTVRDEYYTYRTIRAQVPAGVSEVAWDGCAWNREKLLALKYFTFDFLLRGESGAEYTCSFRSPIARNAQYLQFALPSGGTLYLDRPEDWFIEARAVLDGTLALDLCDSASGEIVYSLRKPLHKGRVERFTFPQLAGKIIPEPGMYTVKAYEVSRTEDAVSFPLQVDAMSPAPAAVEVTGPVMPPEGADDATVWEYMMKPSAVVDIDFLKTQDVLASPEAGAVSLGTLHGQTQGVEVLETDGSWARIGAWNHENASYIEGWVPLEKLKTVSPEGEYGLLVDKKNQTITVFRSGERLETLLISTGHMDPGKLIRETSAGCYLTGYHRVDFSMQGSRYDYVIQYDGGNLLHQIPYTSDGKKDITMGRAMLGAKASHACIRIQDLPCGESGINAYWIWTHIPYHTRIIILDDREEQEKTTAWLEGTTVDEPFPAPAIAGEAPEDSVLLTFAGDVIPGEKEPFYAGNSTITAYLDKFGASYPFSGLSELFGRDDWTSVNLDCTLKADAGGRDYSRGTLYRAVPETAAIFTEGSVEMACLANSHTLDFREEGRKETAAALDGRAEAVCCAHPVITELRGHRIGFGACSKEDYLADPEAIGRDVAQLREAGCEYIVYQCHWGNENDTRHDKLQEAMARACRRAGADLVIGHGPTGVQGIDAIDGMPVLYSLGRLVCGGSGKLKSYDSLAVQVRLDFSGNETVAAIRLLPVLSSSSAADMKNDYRPTAAEGEEKARILSQIQADSVYDLSFLTGE